jgi:hypothetical protein
MSQQIFLLFALLVLLVLLSYAQATPVADAEAVGKVHALKNTLEMV